MKKLFLLLTTGLVALGAGAQNDKSFFSEAQLINPEGLKPMGPQYTINDFKRAQSSIQPSNGDVHHKGTAGGSRTYNYINYLLATGSSSSPLIAPYLWKGGDIMAAYADSTGATVFQPINTVSYAFVLHPQYEGLNDVEYEDAITPYNPIAIKSEPYTLDSVILGGVYGRNPNKNHIVDTLRLAIVYGDGSDQSNLISNSISDPVLETNFGSETINFTTIFYDSISCLATGQTTAPNVEYRDLYLDSSMYLIDSANGSPYYLNFSVPVNLNIPSNNQVAVSATFISGEPYTSTDTAYFGSAAATPEEAFNYGLFRPGFFEEKENGFPTYVEGNFNGGSIKFWPQSTTIHPSWKTVYIPVWLYTAAFAPEFPDISFVISCATCKNTQDYINVNDISNVLSSVSAYPNPAQDFIRIPVTLSKTTDVKVSLLNTVGQVLQTQQLHGNTVTAEFNTAGIPSGVYIYSVEADGQRSTGRVSITR